ncbi:MAG: NTP transferase domain-containing protein [Clostridiales bacterium]|nr:NTP transferase domain-containing protein [Clostridiales bacterium]
MKAVIMAGGEGSRLRPLTCDLPKPMARLCGRPVMEYILDLLSMHGVEEAAVTTRYLPNAISSAFSEDGDNTQGRYRNIRLQFVTEDQPLGTAGSVKHAAVGFDSAFIVISGDALTDFDLTQAVQFHREKGAAATLLVREVDDPREYGLIDYSESGRVTGFLEKPGWPQATTDKANTGIYILDPIVLDMIPDHQEFDFSKDLFPMMMEQGMPLFAYEAQGYWCDIGDLNTYLSCQRDILEGKTAFECEGRVADGVYCRGSLPQGNYDLTPPVYIGQGVRIEDGAHIGPGTVLDDGCQVGRGASVKRSVLLQGAYAGDHASVSGALLCQGAAVKRGGAIYEGAAAGSGAVIGQEAAVLPDIRVWPGKKIEENAVVRENLQFGRTRADYFDDQGISGETGIEITPELCAKIGAAAGSLFPDGRIGVAYSEGASAEMLCNALVAGLLSTGCQVMNFGECPQSCWSFAVGFDGLPLGIHVTGGQHCTIRFATQGGLPAGRNLQRSIEARLQRGEYNRCSPNSVNKALDMSAAPMLYQNELFRFAPEGLSGQAAVVRAASSGAGRMLEEVLSRLGCREGGELRLHLGTSGVRLSAYHPETGYVWPERILAICCQDAFRRGHNVALPFDAPKAIEQIAAEEGRMVLRYLNCPVGECDKEARALAASQPWTRDGLMMAVLLLDIMKRRHKTLQELLSELPQFAVSARVFHCDGNAGRKIRETVPQASGFGSASSEGVVLSDQGGRVILRPAGRGQSIRVIAEAANTEIAEELCIRMENELSRKG